MKMRWYQHSTQGGNCMTSPKNSAPSVETLATSQAPKISVHAGVSLRTCRKKGPVDSFDEETQFAVVTALHDVERIAIEVDARAPGHSLMLHQINRAWP